MQKDVLWNMKKVFLWIGIVLLSPVLLFLLLTAILYIPPVQNWMVDKVSAYVSKSTDKTVSVGRVCLAFPLDLSVEGLLLMQPNDSVPQQMDTIADVGRLVVDVELMPLLQQKVIVDRLLLEKTHVYTDGYVEAAQVKGYIHQLSLSSKGIDLKQESVQLQHVVVDSLCVQVALCDSVPEDTSTAKTFWRIMVEDVQVKRSRVSLTLPGDTLQLGVGLKDTYIAGLDIQLGNGTYQLDHFKWNQGTLTYDNLIQPRQNGLDANHLNLESLHLEIDSVLFAMAEKSQAAPPSAMLTEADSGSLKRTLEGMNLRLYLRDAGVREQSGLELSKLCGLVVLDSTGIYLPQLMMCTPHSQFWFEAQMDLTALDEKNPGQMQMFLAAQVGKEDLGIWTQLVPSVGESPEVQKLCKVLPEEKIDAEVSAEGNIRQLRINRLAVNIPATMACSVAGEMRNMTDMNQLTAQLQLQAKAHNLDFMTKMLPASVSANYRIPHGMELQGQLKANAGRYTADLRLQEGRGSVCFKGQVALPAMAYQAKIDINQLNLHHLMPRDSLFHLTATMNLSGNGTDMYSARTRMNVDLELGQLQYGSWTLDQVTARGQLEKGGGHFYLDSHNALLDGTLTLDALVAKRKVGATLAADVAKADLYAMRLTDKPMVVGVCTHLDIASDLEDYYRVLGGMNDLTIRDEKTVWRPASLNIDMLTRIDTTWAQVQSGDFQLDLHAAGGYRRIAQQADALSAEVLSHIKNRVIDQTRLRSLLPELTVHLRSGSNNPIANFLRLQGVTFQSLDFNLDASPAKGLNGDGQLYSLLADSVRLDTIVFDVKQQEQDVVFHARVENNRKNPQFVFTSLINGKMLERGAFVDVTYLDADKKIGVQLGAKAEMCDSGINVHFEPYRPVLGYKEFNLNEDNYIFMGADKKIQANIRLIADDGTGIMAYSENQDPTMLQDITVSLNKFDLDKITSVIPYAPRVSGIMNGDFHVLQDKDERLSMLSDLNVQKMTYERCPIGDLGTEFVYLQREDSAHYVESRININDVEVGLLKGSYKAEGDGYLDAVFSMQRLPLSIVNGFVPDQIIGLEGYAEGQVDVKGPLSKPVVNGEMLLDSSYLVSVPYGVKLRFDNDPVRVINSKLLLENFTMYAYNENPLNIYGHIDFSNLDRMTVDMKMRARDFQVVNAKKTRQSLVYGKAFVNFGGTMSGPVDRMKMRGQLEVLGKTDLTYILKDSPLNTDDQLKDLVVFTDFREKETIKNTPPPVAGLDMLLLLNIEQGARVVCALNADESNYVNLEGGGELRMIYNTTDDLQLFGRYTLNRGEMKYELPIIPLKTFVIKEGSYIEFTGDIMNPTLNLTATEQVKALVGAETTGSRSVEFECGVKVTQTLNNMGLEFTLDAPDDMTVKNELASMGVEQRGKLAVTMLTTGMYLADGNTSGFSMNSALNSFLQSEINNITKNAMRTVDLSLGLDQSADAAGNTHTDYSFKFAKRFWNNRINFVVGGKISSGNSSATSTTQDQSFIDNVSLEYRLDQTAMKYVRLFYNKEADDLLEGRISEYGAGFVWRKKMERISELFSLKGFSMFKNQPMGDSVNTTTRSPQQSIQ